MAKVSSDQIYLDEKKVLDELRKNAKESIDIIAKKCKFSRQKVWRIIKRLEKNKTIWGYPAVLDDEKQDLNMFIVLIKKTNLPINEQLADTIIGRKIEKLVPNSRVSIINTLYVHGTYDWIISFVAEDIKEAKKFCETLNRIYQGYIEELNLLETLFPVRKQGILNPGVQKLKEYL